MKTSAEPFAILFPGWPVDIEKKRLETISRYQTETRWNKMVRDLEIKRLKRRCSAIDRQMSKWSPTLACIFFLNSDFKSNKETYSETILNSRSALSLDIPGEYKLQFIFPLRGR